MPRFIGGISGVSTSTNVDDGGSGVFGVEQSTYFKREGNWPVGTFASGGTRYYPGDGYAYHTFQVSDNSQPTGTFNMPSAIGTSTIEILLVGGGGGGGNYPSGNSGGAGGAGGVVYYPAFSLTKDTNYTISVGEGGAGASTNAGGTLGGDTTFTSPDPTVATAKGGGAGGAYTANGGAGGSGGGGGGAGASGGPATQPTQTHPLGGTYTNYGNAGGDHPGPNTGISAGGGGAGGAGSGPSPGAGGDGQPFPSFPYTKCGIAPLDPPQNPSPTGDHYGGGGGGCAYSPNVSNYGGLGGGGGSNNADAPSAASGNGVDGLGGGGAGGQGGAGDGGDGIVLIRYQL